jgi:tetratricopeptide (TPR) repeat protein
MVETDSLSVTTWERSTPAAKHDGEAIQAFEQACQVQEKLLQDFPGNLDCHSDLGATLNEPGLALRDRGRSEEAIKALEQAVTHQRIALDGAPRSSQFRFALQNLYGALAEMLRDAGRQADALAATRERKKLNEPD